MAPFSAAEGWYALGGVCFFCAPAFLVENMGQ